MKQKTENLWINKPDTWLLVDDETGKVVSKFRTKGTALQFQRKLKKAYVSTKIKKNRFNRL